MRIHAAPVFAPARIEEDTPGNYLRIGFVPGGNDFGPHGTNIAGNSSKMSFFPEDLERERDR